MVAIQDRVICYEELSAVHIARGRRGPLQKMQFSRGDYRLYLGWLSSTGWISLSRSSQRSCKMSHQQLALKPNLVDLCPTTKYLPNPVLENSCIKLHWDRENIAEVLIRANCSADIVVQDKRMERVTLIDIAVPLDHNVQLTFCNKIAKYHDLAEELGQM